MRLEIINEYDKEMESMRWVKEIPYLDFDKDWLVRALPPFAGAVIRYNIKHKAIKNSTVSIYLDCYDRLGFYGEPYWEVCPYGDDVIRFAMNDTSGLLLAIKETMVCSEEMNNG